VSRVAEGLGPPEILVNAAGNVFSAPGERAQDESLQVILDTIHLNLVAALRLAQAVYPHMLAAGRGSIVNVSSINGHVGVPGIPNASYSASKHGLTGITADLAIQWARKGIRVNTIAPGYFRSEITAPLYDSEEGDAWLRRNTPLPYHGAVDDFVGAVLWLASDAGRYVTGQTIVIDGGWTTA
jgi:NAD(P)-dependent dehydrogenase (short-subunit alcohol dehydrogenase family)